MVNLEKLYQKPRVFKTLCGLTPGQFKKLYHVFKPLAQQAEHRRRNYPGRVRARGGGDRPKLSLEQRLFMVLLYYRTYATQTFIGLVLGLDESNVGRHLKRLHPVLAPLFKIPQRKIRLPESEIWALIVDATEQETQKRPGTGYSGKKKRQTIKTQLHVNAQGVIRAVSRSVPGQTHDKKLYDTSRTFVSRDGLACRVRSKADLGFLGTECDLPIKKPPGRPLMLHEKYHNQKHATGRVIVEHTLAHLKKFKILADRYRNATTYYNLIFRNVCGLRNFVVVTA